MFWKNFTTKKVTFLITWLFVFSFLFTGSAKAFGGKSDSQYRTDTGMFIGKIYKAEEDYYSMCIETSDGNKWIVDNYVHKLFEDCIVTFDTNGTEEVEDDKIIAITINSVIEEG